MNEIEVQTPSQFVELVHDRFSYGYMYRGVEDVDRHLLIPSVGRFLDIFIANGQNKEQLLNAESTAFRIFYTEGARHIRLDNYWQWLALAQHHGLATRLLDWTYNPNVAHFLQLHED